MRDRLPRGECHVWWAPTPVSTEPLLRLLGAREQERADTLRHPPTRSRFITGRAVARLAVADVTGAAPQAIRFAATCRHCAGEHGRLRVHTDAGVIHVSISHSGSLVAMALAWEVICGVDVEQITIRGDDLPMIALSAAEQRVLRDLPEADRLTAFIRYWTRKEAVLKATGDGLLVSPSTLTVSSPSDPPRLLEWVDRPAPDVVVHLADLSPAAGYHAALASLAEPLSIVERHAGELMPGGHFASRMS